MHYRIVPFLVVSMSRFDEWITCARFYLEFLFDTRDKKGRELVLLTGPLKHAYPFHYIEAAVPFASLHKY
jgi:hypothetical protein